MQRIVEHPPFHHPVFVLTHYAREPLALDGGTTFTFVTEGIEAALEQARRAAGGMDVALAGGAKAAQQYLAAGLVDEMEISLVPTLLGSGERLFEGAGDGPARPRARPHCPCARRRPSEVREALRVDRVGRQEWGSLLRKGGVLLSRVRLNVRLLSRSGLRQRPSTFCGHRPICGRQPAPRAANPSTGAGFSRSARYPFRNTGRMNGLKRSYS